MTDTRKVEDFGFAPDGTAVKRVTISNGGVRASFISWGASLQDFRLDSADYSFVLGSPDFKPYPNSMLYFGALVGRVANRISNAETRVEGKALELDFNENGETILHGGSDGSASQNWKLLATGPDSCRFSLRLSDGQGGFPGNLDVTAVYRLSNEGCLILEIEARTDQTTFCNFAHHTYWNLDGTDDLSGHRLSTEAERYLPVDDRLIPKGPAASVAGTRFDFRNPKPVVTQGDALIDHNFCIADVSGPVRPHCVLETEDYQLSVRSTEPGLQVYDASGLDTSPDCGHTGKPYGNHAGLALEPQRWPDAPHQPAYPGILLQPGETYRQTTEFQVTARD